MKTRIFMTGMIILACTTPHVFSAQGKHAVRLTVKGEMEKDRDSSKKESSSSSTKTKTETQHYELAITVANTVKQEGTFDLEWYFLKQRFDSNGKESKAVLGEKDKTALTIGGMKRASHTVQSKKLQWSESKTSKSSSGNNSSGNSSAKSISGESYEGYVILVKLEGTILAKYASNKKFLSPEWLQRLESDPVSGGAKAGTKKKKNRKKKN